MLASCLLLTLSIFSFLGRVSPVEPQWWGLKIEFRENESVNRTDSGGTEGCRGEKEVQHWRRMWDCSSHHLQPVIPCIHFEVFSPAQLIVQIAPLQAPHLGKQCLVGTTGWIEMGNQRTQDKVV